MFYAVSMEICMQVADYERQTRRMPTSKEIEAMNEDNYEKHIIRMENGFYETESEDDSEDDGTGLYEHFTIS